MLLAFFFLFFFSLSEENSTAEVTVAGPTDPANETIPATSDKPNDDSIITTTAALVPETPTNDDQHIPETATQIPETEETEPTDEMPSETQQPDDSPTETNTPKPIETTPISPTETNTPKPIETTPISPTETNTPKPSIPDNSRKFYVCTGESCKKCPDDDLEKDEIQVYYTELNNVLNRNNNDNIKIVICGSSRENHPVIDAAAINDRFSLEIEGKKERQFIEIQNDVILSSLKAEKVTIITHDVVIGDLELEEAPIETESMVIDSITSDLESISSVKNATYVKDTAFIDDKKISSIVIGQESVVLQNADKSKSANISDNHSPSDEDFFLHALITVLAEKREEIGLSVAQGITTVYKKLTIRNYDIDDDDDDDDKRKLTINLDDSWNNVTNAADITIDHGNSHLFIIGAKDEIVNSIKALGSGKVTRNGKEDEETTTTASQQQTSAQEGDSGNSSSKAGLTAGIMISLIVIAGILIVVVFVVIKKCRSNKKQKYGEYLNNTTDLDPIEPI